MQLLTAIRATSWLGLFVAGWSLNLKWGVEEYAGNGPPSHFSRHVVGVALLLLVSALILSIAGRRGRPPSWITRGVAGAFATGSVLVVLWIRSMASDGQDHYLAGAGFMWLFVGAALGLLACLSTLPLTQEKAKAQSGAKGPERSKNKSGGGSKKRSGGKQRKKRRR